MTFNNPLVSVIIPNYNHSLYLDERIQSVLNQTFQNFELIILDDCSTDSSIKVINKYKDNPHISNIVVNKENSGSSFIQWHKGFELAIGEIVWIAESDDSCERTLLETLVNGYMENKAVLAFCKSCQYDIYGNKSCYMLQGDLIKDTVFSGKEFISKYMITKNIVANASSAIFNREIAESIDRKYMTMRGEGDYLFWLELMAHGNVFYCNKELNYFRMHDSNTTKNLTYKGISPLEHKIIYDYLVKRRYLSRFSAWKEKLRCLSCFYETEYESRNVKMKVLNTWDKNRLGRVYISGRMIKNAMMVIIKDLW